MIGHIDVDDNKIQDEEEGTPGKGSVLGNQSACGGEASTAGSSPSLKRVTEGLGALDKNRSYHNEFHA